MRKITKFKTSNSEDNKIYYHFYSKKKNLNNNQLKKNLHCKFFKKQNQFSTILLMIFFKTNLIYLIRKNIQKIPKQFGG